MKSPPRAGILRSPFCSGFATVRAASRPHVAPTPRTFVGDPAGCHGAVWADGQNCPDDGEIDVLEGLDNNTCSAFHSAGWRRPRGLPGGTVVELAIRDLKDQVVGAVPLRPVRRQPRLDRDRRDRAQRDPLDHRDRTAWAHCPCRPHPTRPPLADPGRLTRTRPPELSAGRTLHLPSCLSRQHALTPARSTAYVHRPQPSHSAPRGFHFELSRLTRLTRVRAQSMIAGTGIGIHSSRGRSRLRVLRFRAPRGPLPSSDSRRL